MTAPDQKDVRPARIHWDEDGRPFSLDYQDIYFSGSDPCAESRHVFLSGNALAIRFQNPAEQGFIIGECGFGAGLNFLNTCDLWCETAPPDARLHYFACEKHPLLLEDLRRLHRHWPLLAEYSDALAAQYPEAVPGMHRLHLTMRGRLVVLDLYFGDVSSMLEGLYQPLGFRVDAWFLDGFAPSKNPDMWSPALCEGLARLSTAGTTAASYSAAGTIRRALAAAGFEVERVRGHGQKRHMTQARYPGDDNTPPPLRPAWFTLPSVEPPGRARKVAIIGAGLAGCATAHAFARAGWEVELIEREAEVATMASGNPRGIVFCRTSRQPTAEAKVMLQAYLYALRHYRQLTLDHDFGWLQSGLLQLAFNPEEARRQRDISNLQRYDDYVLRLSSPGECSELAHYPLNMGGFYFPAAASLNPRQLCEAYRRHPGIRTRLSTQALAIIRETGGWRVEGEHGNSGQLDVRADVVVIANSRDAVGITQAAHYPFTLNPGQIDSYDADPEIKTIICGGGYLLPAGKGRYLVGGASGAGAAEEKRAANLKLLARLSPKLAADLKHGKHAGSRSAIRCGTPDFMPLAGPVETPGECRAIFRGLSLNARRQIPEFPVWQKGLFINVAHGSHGITTTPLCADYLASLASGRPLPLVNELLGALLPIRFLIHDLKKRRVKTY